MTLQKPSSCHLTRPRASRWFLPSHKQRSEKILTNDTALGKAINNHLTDASLPPRIIAFDLDETILARRQSCPRSWENLPTFPALAPELRFGRMVPTPWRISKWLRCRQDRDLYSRKLYPFLHTQPQPTLIRAGFPELLRALTANGNTLILITASDRYRLQFLNRLLPDLFKYFGERQLCLEDILTAGSPDTPSAYHKRPELTTMLGLPPFDLLIDDSPNTAEFLGATQQSDRLVTFDPNTPGNHVLSSILEALTGTCPELPNPQPEDHYFFLDPCYLTADPNSMYTKQELDNISA